MYVVVNERGSVHNAEVDASELDDDAVEACVIGVVRTLDPPA